MNRPHLISVFVLLMSFIPAVFAAKGDAPEFILSELLGATEHRLSDYRGKVVYLDFWASFCGPCRKSLPALDALQKDYDKQDFEVIAINVDPEKADALGFLEHFPVSYTVLSEKTGKTQREYNLVGLPTSFLIDQQGEIVGSFQGFHPEHIKRLRKALSYLLAE